MKELSGKYISKRKSVIFFVCILMIIFGRFFIRVYAQDNEKNDANETYIEEINITAELDEYGDAHITETWKMNVYKGTEVYKIMSNMGNKKITNLTVCDETGTDYVNIGAWNVNSSAEEKNGKCGLVSKEGYYEICFGIGEYGYHEYTMAYDVSDFVEQYENDQGINFIFFSELQLEIEKMEIRLTYPGYEFRADNSEIYAFGYEGIVVYEGGGVFLQNDQELESGSNKAQLLMRIDNNTFKDLTENGKDFETVRKDALNGSSYEKDNSKTYVGKIIIVIVVLYILFIVIEKVIRRKKTSANRKIQCFEDGTPLKIERNVDINREITRFGEITTAYFLGKICGFIKKKDRANLINAYILKWIRDGNIKVVKIKTGKTFHIKEEYGFAIINGVNAKEWSCEEYLFRYICHAAGKDSVLKKDEFKEWCKCNYKEILNVFEKAPEEGKKHLKDEKLIRSEDTLFRGDILKKEIYSLEVKEEMKRTVGFREFLMEMSAIDEKEIMDVKLWENYLIIAAVFGIANTVAKRLRRLYPDFDGLSNINPNVVSVVNKLSEDAAGEAEGAMRAAKADAFGSGHGGRSFGSGGGGDSSGGGGGGVR